MTMIRTANEDKELIERIIRKDERAVHNFYKQYRSQIFGFVYKRIPKKHIAEEITQDILSFSSLPHYSIPHSFQ